MSDIEKANHRVQHNEIANGNGSHMHNSAVDPVPQPGFGQGGVPIRKLGNPGPLGLMSFATTTLVLSLINASARSVTTPNVVVGLALFTGGLAQLLAGMWEFAVGNTFGATAFSSYGAFWLSYATILIPGSGVLAGYTSAVELHNALGIFLTSWTIVTFIFLIGSLRKNVSFIALFICLTITFGLLAGAEFTGGAHALKAGGVLGVITALIAYYIALAQLLTQDDWFTLPLFEMPKRRL
ncbi:hypothetical protein JAAARDRAFT_41243 [Jaapia argillacea MUCL 33604]|uniref:Uncharacterized protein n=1 Tax=Jaapia argillacea MUCL 33604 TaxID=933084 RepID=A0A067P9E6_9AGAM|nr:hypothetical protein JAAARDRAFT_41243 [Jaapia argillacea MUCL 33604]